MLGAGCLRMATKMELLHYFGLAAGTVGPVRPDPSLNKPILLVDSALADAAQGEGSLVLLGSGDIRYHLALRSDELVSEAVGGRLGALSMSCGS